MKRISIIFLALMLSVFLVSCSGGETLNEAEKGIVGVWRYSANDDYVLELVTDIIDDPNVYVAYFYEFYEDGTGKTYVSTDDEVIEFTYSFNGEVLTITSEDGSFDTPCKLKGDVLSVYDEVTGEYLDMKRQ